MIDLFMWPTGNGKKITIMLEECGLPYRPVPVNIGKGDQHSPEFAALNPNRKIPVIIDHDAARPVVIFESGAILQYLAEKTGQFMPTDISDRYRVLQWLYWQVGGFGPKAGEAHHYLRYAPQKIEYAMARVSREMDRLYSLLDEELAKRQYIAGEYSIADMAIWPWVYRHEWQGQDLAQYPSLSRWFSTIAERPAVKRALEVGKDWMDFSVQMSDEEKKTLFNLRDSDFQRVEA